MKKNWLLIPAYAIAMAANAQNNNSPYSIIGIGDVEGSFFDRTAGMGGAGTALSSATNLIQANPASYSKLADHYFMAEVSARYQGTTYTGTPINLTNYKSGDLQFKKFAMAIKVKPFWGASVGLAPFSRSAYSFYADKSVAGINTLNNTYYEGNGGLNQFYFANAFSLTKNLSIGVQASYLFGSFQQTETLDSIALGSSLITNRNRYMGKMYLKGGMQYQAKLSKHWQLGLGATAALKTNISSTYYLTVTSNGETVTNSESVESNYFTLPFTYSAGISLKNNDRFTFVGDYQFQRWGDMHYTGLGYSLVNSSRYAAGIEFSKKVRALDYYYEKSNLQAGFYYNNTYLQIGNQQLVDYGFTAGTGLGIKGSNLSYQLNLAVGSKGTTQNKMIKETYVQIGITISYKEIWWTKMKRYD